MKEDEDEVRSMTTSARLSLPLLAMAMAVPFMPLASAPARAQGIDCAQFQGFIEERKSIVARINALNKDKQKMDAKQACGIFGRLAGNGSTTLKWLESNKDWCNIPPTFIENFKADHEKATLFRGKACTAAAQQAALEKKAKQGAANGLLGGDSLTGPVRMPQGAL
jgi:hypothetical protein